MTGRLSQPLRAPCPLLSEPPMARGVGAPDCLRAWDGKEAFNICTWGPGAWCWGSIRGGRSGLHPEETRALAGRRAPGGAVFLLSGQRPVSAFNCPRLGGAPGIHGRQPRTLPTPPPSARAGPFLDGQPIYSCSSHCVGGGGWGPGSEPSLELAALPTAPPRRQGRTQEPGV